MSPDRLFCCIGDVKGSGISPPPGEGSWSLAGLLGESPCGDEGDREFRELEVDIAVGMLLRKFADPLLLLFHIVDYQTSFLTTISPV